MAELFGAIQRGLGAVLNGIYEVIPSYLIAIILLTIATRIVLLPLTVKQMRSTRAMQKLQPEMKEIQKKYKDLQKKVKDRQELQEIRLQQNQEVMALYKKHGANPAGCAGSLVAQMPVFIALFTIFRASVLMLATTVQLVTPAGLSTLAGDEYTPEQAQATICRPVEADAARPFTLAEGEVHLECITQVEDDGPTDTKEFVVSGLVEVDGRANQLGGAEAAWVARCNPVLPAEGEEGGLRFGCTSATGTGHLPRDGELYADVNADRATILGMHPGCTPSQARTESGLRQCSAGETDTGLLAIAPYYLLVLLIAATQYVAGKQMMGRSNSQGQAAQQQAMMTKIMPIFFGFISLSFPAGLNTYYFVFNLWQMGQQHLMLNKLDAEEASGAGPSPKKGLMDRARQQIAARQAPEQAQQPAEAASDSAPEPSQNGQPAKKKPHPRSKKKKKRRR